MNKNKIIVFVVIGLLAVSALGFVSVKALAKAVDAPVKLQEPILSPDKGSSTEVSGPSVTESVEATEVSDPAGEEVNVESQDTPITATPSISVEQANTVALVAVPGGTIVKTDLSDENGVLVYAVEFANGTEVKVDATTGLVLSTDSSVDSNSENSTGNNADNNSENGSNNSGG